jgi:hypothetical protein
MKLRELPRCPKCKSADLIVCGDFKYECVSCGAKSHSHEVIVHGISCKKKPHVRSGYLHGEDDDTPYNVDGLKYCGRCHTAI